MARPASETAEKHLGAPPASLGTNVNDPRTHQMIYHAPHSRPLTGLSALVVIVLAAASPDRS
jgi:hypothetical protein